MGFTLDFNQKFLHENLETLRAEAQQQQAQTGENVTQLSFDNETYNVRFLPNDQIEVERDYGDMPWLARFISCICDFFQRWWETGSFLQAFVTNSERLATALNALNQDKISPPKWTSFEFHPDLSCQFNEDNADQTNQFQQYLDRLQSLIAGRRQALSAYLQRQAGQDLPAYLQNHQPAVSATAYQSAYQRVQGLLTDFYAGTNAEFNQQAQQMMECLTSSAGADWSREFSSQMDEQWQEIQRIAGKEICTDLTQPNNPFDLNVNSHTDGKLLLTVYRHDFYPFLPRFSND